VVEGNNQQNSFGVRIFFALLPMIVAAVFGQGLYVLVWGIKLENRVAAHEGRVAEMRLQVDKINELVTHRVAVNSTKFGSIEEQMNEQAQRIDTLIALMKVRERSDVEYVRPREPSKFRMQSDDNPASSPP
jgi:hypothetical protein